MNDNTKQQKPISPPPPPPLRINIRTMQSDIESIKQSGGEAPSPQTFTPEEFKPKTSKQKIENSEVKISLNVPSYTGPEKPIFKPSQTPSPTTSQVPIPPLPTDQKQPKSSFIKIILIAIGVIVGIAGLGLLGYYIIFPLFF